MNLRYPELSPDERLRRRLWLEHAITGGFLAREQAETWGFSALVENRIKPPKLRVTPEHGGLTDEERNAIVMLIQEGSNLSSALTKLDISINRYKKEVVRDRSFANEVKSAGQYMEGICTEIVSESLIESRDPKMALDFLPKLMKMRETTHAIEYNEKKQAIEMKVARARLREMQVEPNRETDYDFSMLGKRQFERYTTLCGLSSDGHRLTVAEHQELGELVSTIIRKASEMTPEEEPKGYKALDPPTNGHSNGNGHHNNGNGYHNGSNGNGKH